MNKRILITAPIRQKEDILKKYLESLNNLEVPENYTIEKMFILHNCYDNLKSFFGKDDILFKCEDESIDTLSKDKNTHLWTSQHLSTVSQMKNTIVKYAIDNKYDLIFWVDSDLILHKETLRHLVKQAENNNIKIIGELFWTAWDKKKLDDLQPNAWDTDYYNFYYGYKRFGEKKAIYEVGGTGACILVDIDVYKNIKNSWYSPIKNISWSIWEDRAFCIKASIQGYRIYLDNNYPATHLYHD